MSLEDSFIEDILITENIKNEPKIARSVKMTQTTNGAFSKASEETIFSQEGIVKIGVYYARIIDAKLKSKKLKSAKQNFKNKVPVS